MFEMTSRIVKRIISIHSEIIMSRRVIIAMNLLMDERPVHLERIIIHIISSVRAVVKSCLCECQVKKTNRYKRINTVLPDSRHLSL